MLSASAASAAVHVPRSHRPFLSERLRGICEASDGIRRRGGAPSLVSNTTYPFTTAASSEYSRRMLLERRVPLSSSVLMGTDRSLVDSTGPNLRSPAGLSEVPSEKTQTPTGVCQMESRTLHGVRTKPSLRSSRHARAMSVLERRSRQRRAF